ncbi:hypothetical protein Pan241w_26190 [Gimesia alba]|uniref:DUF1508 domain-containing protein n=2 Tax=Gimesia alba TaxID=2527973 RepID=A0A517RF79_9PLAN|nr:hypothetical protein Pan241w_26190 [Gimesia alba]
MAYYIYKDISGQWRWRYVAGNNRIIAVSSESYFNKADCQNAVEIMRRSWESEVFYLSP